MVVWHQEQTGSAGIVVRRRPRHAPTYAAIVALVGEHDLLTARDVRDALTETRGDVLVDLTDCTFLDSSIVHVLLTDMYGRRRDWYTLELIVPARNQLITSALEALGASEVLFVHESLHGSARWPG